MPSPSRFPRLRAAEGGAAGPGGPAEWYAAALEEGRAEHMRDEARADLRGALRRLVQETERNPSNLLYGRSPVPPGPGETTAGKGSP